METARKIETRAEHLQTLCEIAVAQAKAERPEAAAITFASALDAAREFEDRRYRSWAIREIAVAHAEAGLESARDLLDEAENLAYQIENKSQHAEALREIASARAQIGQVRVSQRTFAAAFKMARGIGWEGGLTDMLREFTHAQALAGNFAAALKTARVIRRGEDRGEALRDIAVAQAQAQHGEQAVRTSEMILFGRNRLLPQIADALAKAGDPTNFKRLLISCASYSDSSLRVCAPLALLYPDEAATIAQIVRNG